MNRLLINKSQGDEEERQAPDYRPGRQTSPEEKYLHDKFVLIASTCPNCNIVIIAIQTWSLNNDYHAFLP